MELGVLSVSQSRFRPPRFIDSSIPINHSAERKKEKKKKESNDCSTVCRVIVSVIGRSAVLLHRRWRKSHSLARSLSLSLSLSLSPP